MKTAIVGSRCATAADYGLIGENLPPGTTEIISGGAQGVDQLARRYALARPAALIPGYGGQRHAAGEQFVRGAIMLACLTGNVGVSGGWAAGWRPSRRPLR